MDTIFHKIIKKEIPAEILYEDEDMIAISDIRPAAPVHLLVIPKKTLPSLAEATDEDALLLGRLLICVKKMAEKFNLPGYRVAINVGKLGGQEVFQLHLHLIGGRSFSWPPG